MSPHTFWCRFLYLNCLVLSLLTLLHPSLAWAQNAAASASHSASIAQQAVKAEHVPAELSKDARLDRRISLHEIGTPFNALLKKVSVPDLTLTVETDSAERKLHINIKQRSVRHLMQSLADLLPGYWYARQDGSGYRFEMDYRTVRRRRRWWELFLAEREKAFNAMRAAVLHAMRTPPQRPAKFITDHAHEDGIDEETWNEIARQKTVFNSLPAGLQEQIANQINDTPWYNLRGLVTASGIQEGALLIPLRAFPDEIKQRFGAVLQGAAGNTPSEQNVCVMFTNFGVNVLAALVTLDGRMLRQIGTLPVPSSADMIPLKLNQVELPQEVKKRGKEAPPAWRELAAFQQSHVWPNDLPKQSPPRELPNRIDMQEQLAQAEGVEFVSDYYTAFRGTADFYPEKLSVPLKEELDWQAQAQDISWKQEAGNGIYLFRSNRWYRDDFLEIPAAQLQWWINYKKRQIGQALRRQKSGAEETPEVLRAEFRAEMDGIADNVSALTSWQLFNGLGNVVINTDEIPLSPIEQLGQKVRAEKGTDRPGTVHPRLAFDQEVLGILFQYRTLLFYGSLGQEARAALRAGRLDVASLTPAQQQQVRYVLPALQVVSPPLTGEPLRIGIQQEPYGWVGIPFQRLVLISPASSPQN